MGHARCSFTCLISSITSGRAEVLDSALSTKQQHLRQEERHRQEAHSCSSCQVDLVAGDFNGTAWRYRSKDNLSTIDEAFTDCASPTPPAPHHCGDLDPFRTIGQTSADFSNHRVLHRFWKVHKHGAFSIPRKTLGLRPTDQSCHHGTWLHLDFVDWDNRWSKHDVYEQHISLQITHTGIQKDVLLKS